MNDNQNFPPKVNLNLNLLKGLAQRNPVEIYEFALMRSQEIQGQKRLQTGPTPQTPMKSPDRT